MKQKTIFPRTTEHTTVTTVADESRFKFTQSTEIDTVLLKVASRCNIDCDYCYVYHMGDDNWSRLDKFMSQGTIEATCSSLSSLAKNQEKLFSLVLHGGEPLLMGEKRLNGFLQKLREALGFDYPISIQTNGLLITNNILDICSINKVSVAVSIDGPRSVNDNSRLDHKGNSTYDKVIRGIELLKSHNDSQFIFAGLLAVIDPASAPAEVYHFFKDTGTPSVDFLYKDGNHSRLPQGKASPDSIEYGKWMAKLLDVYLGDPTPIIIRVLDDMLKVLLGGVVTKEGLGITDFGIIIIDTDGTITKNDTLKSSFNGADQFVSPINVKDGDLLSFLNSNEFQDYRKLQRPSSEKCITCPILNVCGGGMTLHRWKDDNGFDNPSIYCADQMHLAEAMKKHISLLELRAHD